MLIQNKQIAIAGGGPGGLTLARLLQMNGANVKVYERDIDEHARVQGATLDLHEESGLEALRQGGLIDAFRANYRPGADKVRIMDEQGRILADEHTETGPGKRDESRPEIDRGPLRKIMLDSLKLGTVVWNSQFVSMTPQGDGWQITFQNGTNAYADIVIGADGANSKIRPYITSIKPFYSGVTAVEGIVYDSAIAAPRMHELLKDGKIFAFGNAQSLIVSAKGDGSLAFYIGFKSPEHWTQSCNIDFKRKTEVLAWFLKEFSTWDSVWYELFENASYFIPRPQYCMPLDQTWPALSNLTMLGDAAHLMPPYAGEGVNMAMQDALELSQHLLSTSHVDIQSAIAAYENQMRRRASEIAGFTLEQTEILHSMNAINHMMQIIG